MKGNRGLFNKKRFKKISIEKERFLRKLTLKKSIKIFELLTSAEALNEFKYDFLPDNPQCLKLTLMRKKSESTPRGI